MSILNWSKVGSLSADEIYLKVMLYGDSGAGKTWAASTSPSPCYLLTEPNGLPTIRAANPEAIVVQADEAHGGIDTVRAFLRAAKDGTLAEQTGFKTVVLDSMNELQRMLHDEIMGAHRGTPQEGTFTLQDWGELTDKMRSLVRAFRDLPYHVVGITHASVDKEERTSSRHISPAFQGKALPNEIAGYFSAVGYMYRERKKDEDDNIFIQRRVLLTGPPTVLCKGLPGLDAVEEPDLTKWLKKMAEYDHKKSSQVAEAADPTKKRSRRSRSRG
jgi:hypothetical protein